MKNILITGADGFIGSHLTNAMTKDIKSRFWYLIIQIIIGVG